MLTIATARDDDPTWQLRAELFEAWQTVLGESAHRPAEAIAEAEKPDAPGKRVRTDLRAV